MSFLDLWQFDMLTHPWALVLLILVVLLFAAEISSRPFGVISISTGETLAKIKGNTKMYRRHLPALLRAFGLVFLIVALARPLNGMRPRVEREEVVDIIMCVDVSGSMTAEDFIVGRRRRDRLYVTKLAVQDFIESRKIRGSDRFGTDRVGLILYAAHAWMQCPLTLDYGVFERELEAVAIDKNDPKSHRTAIGSALGLSVSRLNKSEAKSKVIVLLTDGINNHGSLDPITAAQLAKEYGVRIYTIGAGATAGGGGTTRKTIFGPRFTSGSNADTIDEATLIRIAEITGGKYYRATDLDSLQGAYDEINALETTEVDVGDAYDYDDGFVPYAFVGAMAMSASIFSRRRWFESIP